MGEARQKAGRPATVVYHHTSTLRTNLIWMSGKIELEGRSKGVFHPKLGEIQTDVKARRPCNDFAPLAWFTSSIVIPACLQEVGFQLGGKDGSASVRVPFGSDARSMSNAVALNRVAIGFPLEGSTIIPWREHAGYETEEGWDLNESAREVGDDPDRWHVSDVPVDMMTASEIWVSLSKYRPKLQRMPGYLDEVKTLVQRCRDRPDIYVPPSWLTPDQAAELAKSAGIEMESR